jgi:outer membrane lipoprotein-sorting protein
MTRPIAMLTAAVLLLAACPGPHRQAERPYPAPTAESLRSDLAGQRERARSYQAESVMDYWVGGERVRGTVLLMGERGARIRLNALNPTGDNVAADLACDGTDFKLIDYNNNCQLTGPCTRESIAQLLRVELEPDDFLLLVLGQAPVLPDARASLRWEPEGGHEVLTLKAADGRQQTIALRRSDAGWEILSASVRDAGGDVEWTLENKDFETITGPGGAPFRVPQRTRFRQPGEKADLVVRWKQRTVNPTLDAAKFTMAIPAGLPRCGDGG